MAMSEELSATLSQPPALLQARELGLYRGGRQLFDQLSFDIRPGQFMQLQGRNGAGKTSLMRILAGLSRYGFSGTVRRCAPLLYAGHQTAVKPLLSPRENLAWHVAGDGCYSARCIEQALAQVGLFGFEDVPSHSLSAGQQRRVNLARLYLSETKLWLLDEPFTAIDKEGVVDLSAALLAHLHSGGAVLLTSHQSLALDYPLLQLNLDRGLHA